MFFTLISYWFYHLQQVSVTPSSLSLFYPSLLQPSLRVNLLPCILLSTRCSVTLSNWGLPTGEHFRTPNFDPFFAVGISLGITSPLFLFSWQFVIRIEFIKQYAHFSCMYFEKFFKSFQPLVTASSYLSLLQIFSYLALFLFFPYFFHLFSHVPQQFFLNPSHLFVLTISQSITLSTTAIFFLLSVSVTCLHILLSHV